MKDIVDIIAGKLDSIESDKGVHILFAVESGSRAWGFPSADSDYDVRFVYVRPKNDYLSIINRRDTLEFPMDGDIDVCGWDIRKLLQHISKSNSVVYEWLQSPTVYKEKHSSIKAVWEMALPYFSPLAAFKHYLGLCRKYFPKLSESERVKIKTVFYVLRPLFALNWIQEKAGVPPMTFKELLDAVPEKTVLSQYVTSLLKIKTESSENTLTAIPSEISSCIDHIYSRCQLQPENGEKTKDPSELDELFRDFLERHR